MTLIERMLALSAAEDFFALLDAPYDPAVIGRARLHILKRMGQMLAGGALDGLGEDTATAKARALLIAAHDEFVGAQAIDKRLFKVLADRDPARPAASRKAAFVPLSDIMPVA